MTFEELLRTHPTILVVDDVSSARKIFVKLLQKLGISNVEEAGDGVQALDILKSKEVKLVLSDWQMPNLGGLELLKAVKDEPQLNMIPFVMVTSHSDKDSVQQALNFGVSDFVLKPFSVQILKEKIEKLLCS